MARIQSTELATSSLNQATFGIVTELSINWKQEVPGTYTNTGYTDTVTGVTWDVYTSGSDMGTMAITIDLDDGLKIAGSAAGADRYLGLTSPIADLINAVTLGGPYDPEFDVVEILIDMEVSVLTNWTYGHVAVYTDAGPYSDAGRWNWNNSQVCRVTNPAAGVQSRLESGNEFILGCRISKGRWSWRSNFDPLSLPDSILSPNTWSYLTDHTTSGGVFTDFDDTNTWDGDPGWNLDLRAVGQLGGPVTCKFYKTIIRRYRAQ